MDSKKKQEPQEAVKYFLSNAKRSEESENINMNNDIISAQVIFDSIFALKANQDWLWQNRYKIKL